MTKYISIIALIILTLVPVCAIIANESVPANKLRLEVYSTTDSGGKSITEKVLSELVTVDQAALSWNGKGKDFNVSVRSTDKEGVYAVGIAWTFTEYIAKNIPSSVGGKTKARCELNKTCILGGISTPRSGTRYSLKLHKD